VKPWSVALIVILLVAVSPLRGISVLCISEMGHLKVEFVGSSCCDQESAPQIPSALLVEESTDDCGTCVDVLFSQDASRASQRGSSAYPSYSLFNSNSSIPQLLTGFLGTDCSKEINSQCSFFIVPLANNQFSTVIRC
jgi:hypothetical protein